VYVCVSLRIAGRAADESKRQREIHELFSLLERYIYIYTGTKADGSHTHSERAKSDSEQCPFRI
jgi:hypothetical protein